MDTAVLVALGIDAALVVVAGEDGVEQDARQGGDGQAGERDGGAGHGEGDAAGEAQAAHQDDGGDDEVAGLGQVHVVLHDVAHADGGDHAVENEGHAAHDGGGHRADDVGHLGNKGEHDGIDGRQTDDPGVMDLGQDQDAGILAIRGVGGAAEHAGQGGGDAVAHQGAVQAGLLNEVLPHGGGDGGHVADVLHHGGQGDGGHHQDSGEVKLGHLERKSTSDSS